MHIGFDIGPVTRTRTGVGNYCYFLLRHLLQLDEDCRFSGFASGLRPLDLRGLEGLAGHRHLKVPTRLLYKLWQYARFPKVDRLLGGVDVYHATNYFLPPTVRARRVVTIHDLAFLAVPALCSPKIVGPFAKGLRRFAREADAIMAYSESTRRDIVRFLNADPEKIEVAPMAVDDGFKAMPRDEAARLVGEQYGVKQPFLLFVSTLEPRKNVPGLLRAFARLKDDIPHNLLLIGSVGWNADEIFTTIDTLDLGTRVIRPGFVPHAELPAFYSAAAAFLFPTYYEGFGLPLLEALTCGCPVVASDNSSVPEVTGDAAIRVDANDEAAFADAVRRVLEDEALRKSMIQGGLAHASGYSWRTCAEATMAVYRKVAT